MPFPAISDLKSLARAQSTLPLSNTFSCSAKFGWMLDSGQKRPPYILQTKNVLEFKKLRVCPCRIERKSHAWTFRIRIMSKGDYMHSNVCCKRVLSVCSGNLARACVMYRVAWKCAIERLPRHFPSQKPCVKLFPGGRRQWRAVDGRIRRCPVLSLSRHEAKGRLRYCVQKLRRDGTAAERDSSARSIVKEHRHGQPRGSFAMEPL